MYFAEIKTTETVSIISIWYKSLHDNRYRLGMKSVRYISVWEQYDWLCVTCPMKFERTETLYMQMPVVLLAKLEQ
jgi:hypothetical protein